MKKKIGSILKKFSSAIMAILIFISSIPITPLIMKVSAMSTVSGDKIIEVAQSYSDWGYYDVGTCTGLVTRTLNKLGIGESIVGIHPYDIDTPQSSGGARYSPDGMYRNAINHPEDAKLIWQGYVKDIEANAHLFKNGDLIIQRAEDKANYTGDGHVGFMHIYGSTIANFGAGTTGIKDYVMATNVMTRNIPPYVNSMDYISVFRLTEAEPIYETLTSEKTANEIVEVSFYKTDVDTKKPLSGVEVDFYRDDVKFASGVTNDQGIAVATSVTTYTATSTPKTYVTNWDDLGTEGQAQVDERGAYHNEVEARVAADSEAQKSATEKASQTHRYTVVETKTKTKYWLNPDNTTDSDSATGSGSISLDLTNERVRGTAILYKEDADVKHSQNEAEIDGALYGLYARENILDPADASIIYYANDEVTRVRIEDGQAQVDDLYLGAYYWRELTAGTGYSIDNNQIDFDLTYIDQTVNTVIAKSTSKEEVFVGDFEVEKIITSGEESEIVEKEKGAEFIVVAKKYVEKYGSIEDAWEHRSEFTEKEYDKLITNELGYAKSKKLAYGTFVIKQIKGKMDTEQVKDTWEFTVSKENQDTIKYIINNRYFTSYVKLQKKDLESGKLITLSDTTFKIKNADTGEYLSQKVADTTYSTWKTDGNGWVQLPLEVKAGTWILEEIESPNLYVINKEGQSFRVTNTNIVEVDKDGDPILTVTMLDKPVKGQIKVEKKGEVLSDITTDENGNTQFIYEEKYLAGMTVYIQAAEDIIDPADGSILYKEGEIVDIVTTTNEETFSKLLPLGHYKAYEYEAPNGMVIDTIVYDINLEFQDNETEVVVETLSIINERQKVEVDLTKLDKDRNIALEGVIFNLRTNQDILSYDGKVLVKSGEIIETGKTDKDGKLKFEADLPISFDDEIYFEITEEKSLEGYYPYEETIKIDTKYKGQNIKKISNSETIYNTPIKNYVLINKVDNLTLENIKSKDFSFRVCKDEGCNEIVDIYKANTDEGTALIPIYYGQVLYASEYEAPEGYMLSSEVVKIKLNSEGLFINDELVETDEDLLYSIKYQNSLLPVIQENTGVQTGYDNNMSLYIILGSLSLAGIATIIVTLSKKKKKK